METDDEQKAARILKAIGDARVVPVLRTAGEGPVIAEARRLLDAGLFLVEIAATTPNWLQALSTLRSCYADAILGIGTITEPRDALAALQEGADFLVCPHLAPAVRAVAGGALIEGGFTPGEIAAASQYGLAKLFPAHAVEPRYLSSLLAVMPDAHIMPTGGIALQDVPAWLAVGAHAVGIGSGLSELADPFKSLQAVLNDLQPPG